MTHAKTQPGVSGDLLAATTQHQNLGDKLVEAWASSGGSPVRAPGSGPGAVLDPILPLLQAEEAPSFSLLGSSMVRALGVKNVSREGETVRDELTQLLWDKEWAPEPATSKDRISINLRPETLQKAIVRSLQFDALKLREEAIPQNLKDTYAWIFQGAKGASAGAGDDEPAWDSFTEWLESNEASIYWVTGKPGSGKSTMMKFIVQHECLPGRLAKWAGPLPLLVGKYYAWSSGYDLQRSLQGLKRTIVSQALEMIPDLASTITPRRWSQAQVLRSVSFLPAWEAWEIEESFDLVLAECGKSIRLALFIDGLDEFAVPPGEVATAIQSITSRCSNGLKLCVSSRPWPEFGDRFGHGPMLQMHLLTEADIRTFVTRAFQGNQGFVEQAALYPEAAAQLQSNIVEKANGVFLWVSAVVTHLMVLFTEGGSVAASQTVLDALPEDISMLYDAIWESIRPQNRGHASIMIRVVDATAGPVPWRTMWLIEESGGGLVEMADAHRDSNWRALARQSLRRKLAARTKCILETTSGPEMFVDFIHRTARDWAVQPHVWQRICSESAATFDPFLALVQAQRHILSDETTAREYNHTTLWRTVARTLNYARKFSTDDAQLVQEFVAALDGIDKALGRIHKLIPQVAVSTALGPLRMEIAYWVDGQLTANRGSARTNTFLGLVAQFSILAYIKAKAEADRSLLHGQSQTKHSVGLLENAIFGFERYMPPVVLQDGAPSPSEFYAARLETVKFLLDQGVAPTNDLVTVVHDLARPVAPTGTRYGYGRQDAKSQAHTEAAVEYFKAVAEYLDARDWKVRIKSTLWRVQSAMKSGR